MAIIRMTDRKRIKIKIVWVDAPHIVSCEDDDAE